MNQIARLKWLCRRGTKELDYLLLAYLEHLYVLADDIEQMLFKELLTRQDSELIQLLLSPSKKQSTAMEEIVEKIRKNPHISS